MIVVNHIYNKGGITMYISFFDICFECNEISPDCEFCKYNTECRKFYECFGHVPKILWSTVTSFDYLLNYVNKWREYNNGTTVKH